MAGGAPLDLLRHREHVGNPEDEAAAEVYMRSVVQAYSRRVEAALDEVAGLPEWRDVGALNDWPCAWTPR